MHYPAFFHQFFCNVHQRYRNGKKRDLLPIHTSRKTQAPALIRALATIPLIASREDTAGDLSGCCQKTVQTPKCRRLPITKKSVERKDGGVVACQPVSLAHLHRIPHCRGDTGNQEYLQRRRGQELVYQSVAFCLENFCYLLCPCYQFPEEVRDHSNNEKSVGGYLKNPYPGGYMNRFYAVICP